MMPPPAHEGSVQLANATFFPPGAEFFTRWFVVQRSQMTGGTRSVLVTKLFFPDGEDHAPPDEGEVTFGGGVEYGDAKGARPWTPVGTPPSGASWPPAGSPPSATFSPWPPTAWTSTGTSGNGEAFSPSSPPAATPVGGEALSLFFEPRRDELPPPEAREVPADFFVAAAVVLFMM